MNKLIYPGVSLLNVDDEIVNIFDNYINQRKNNRNFPIYDYATINGNQTENLINLIENGSIEGECLIKIKNIIENHITAKFEYHWAHAISYKIGGYQNKHTHDHNEECSFILYLNGCNNGETNFYVNPTRNIQYKIKPEKGKLVVFSPSISHNADITDQEKKIIVGGLKIIK